MAIATADVVVIIDGLALNIKPYDGRRVALSLILVVELTDSGSSRYAHDTSMKESTDQVQRYRSTLNRSGLNGKLVS